MTTKRKSGFPKGCDPMETASTINKQKDNKKNLTKNNTTCQLSNTNAATQCLRLLKQLKQGPINTFQAREDLNIAHPAGRICDLRQLGHNIETHTCKESTTEGSVSRVALYILIEEPGEG